MTQSVVESGRFATISTVSYLQLQVMKMFSLVILVLNHVFEILTEVTCERKTSAGPPGKLEIGNRTAKVYNKSRVCSGTVMK